MYSTSSSECECDADDYCSYTTGYGNQGGYRTPFYPTMGHPLIYYAQMPQVPQPFKRQRSRENRRENCFAKAFRWYTQEHVPQRSYSHNKMEVNAFAAWLDSKYDEFLRDSQLDNVYHLKMKRTSIVEADRIPNNSCCEPRSKRFRVKSPWRKKHQNSKEAGDVIQKPNQSFQFILKPKELTRVTSDCQPSTATMISNVIPMKATIKSQSYTLVTYEPDISFDDKPDVLEKSKSSNRSHKAYEVKSVNETRNEAQNISCQCSTIKVEKTNGYSQYDCGDAEKSGLTTCDDRVQRIICHRNHQPCNNTTTPVNNDIPKPAATKVQAKSSIIENLMICQCSNEINSKADPQTQQTHTECDCLLNIKRSCKVVKTCPCESEEVLKVENPTTQSFPITFSSDGVQTSNHSIHLGKDTHGFPLFMKIVCADKLSE